MSYVDEGFSKIAPKSSPVAMVPEALPQQRLYEVVDLPPRPAGLHGFVDWINPMSNPPRGAPRKLVFLGSVEWAWSPMHSRIDCYYLNPKPDRWIIWNHRQDDNSWSADWKWTPYAWCRRTPGDPLAIGTWLLLDAWTAEAAEGTLDHFHFINDEGSLGVSRLRAVANAVWAGEKGKKND